ncbi:MAG: MFS transporter [Candidatus Aenigmatarchaeota archaeon]
MSQNKRVFFIQSVDSFVGGILWILLPLLMLERGIDIISIGLIYSALPMIFQITRFMFAILSDFLGRKIFFLLNGILRIFYLLIYYFAFSPLEFLFGKIAEGTSNASLWAVNRAFVLEQNKEKRKNLIKMRVFGFISEALGTLLAGVIILFLFYSNALLFCVFISLLSIPASLEISEKRKKSFGIKEILKVLDLSKKTKIFKKSLLIFFTLGLSIGLTAYYVLPLFLKQNGYTIETIGIILGVQVFISGISLHFLAKKLSFEKAVIYGATLYFTFLLLLCFLKNFWVGIILILFGIADGILTNNIEIIFSTVATNGFAYGTDIGLLMTAFHTGRTISLIFSGFIISFFGFSLLFLSSGMIFILYSLLLLYYFKELKLKRE